MGPISKHPHFLKVLQVRKVYVIACFEGLQGELHCRPALILLILWVADFYLLTALSSMTGSGFTSCRLT